MWKYYWILLFWSYAVVLTECTGLNKLFLHLMRALCFCVIMISYLVFFIFILLIRNHMIFLMQCGIHKYLLIFQRPQIARDRRARAILLVFEKINSCLFNPNCTRNNVITYTKMYHELRALVPYRWHRLRALYLNSALVWRKACALWKYNELVLTNHGARISLNIL